MEKDSAPLKNEKTITKKTNGGKGCQRCYGDGGGEGEDDNGDEKVVDGDDNGDDHLHLRKFLTNFINYYYDDNGYDNDDDYYDDDDDDDDNDDYDNHFDLRKF